MRDAAQWVEEQLQVLDETVNDDDDVAAEVWRR
jgi:hypothetical protein